MAAHPADRSVKHIDFLDHIRGIAILVVFLHHAVWVTFDRFELPFGKWFRDFSVSKSFVVCYPVTLGWMGVSIFFVVSGFCIHLAFHRSSKGEWPDFFIRRFFRIYPPYLVALLFFAVIFPPTRLPLGKLYGLAQLGSHALLIHNFHPESFYGINGSFWSLAVEWQLYLMYPLLLLLVASLGWNRSLLVLGVIEAGLRFTSGAMDTFSTAGAPRWLNGLALFYWFSWSIGAALADAFLHGRPLPFAKKSVAAWLFVAVGCSLVKPLAPLAFLCFAIATAVGISKLLNGEKPAVTLPHFLSEHLRVAGLWSYSLYLLHQPLMKALMVAFRSLPGMSSLPHLAVYAICLLTWFPILALAFVFHKCCELPGIAWGKKFSRNVRARSAQVDESGRV